MTELVTVTAQIPTDRVSEFYEMVAALNRPKSNTSGNQSPRPWSEGDEHLAKQIFAACSPNARKVLSYLADHPDQQVLGTDIAAALAMPKGHMAIAGTLGPVGVHCKKVGRDMPYQTHYATGATAAFYVMSKEVTELFRAAA
ncbi:MAG: hypothetical protein JOZ71_05780 [Ktedonobacteraceae bacterium]|nr:hypothetical protein [Ktedonobacteraceae bacterium]